jgi:hypothetical protein
MRLGPDGSTENLSMVCLSSAGGDTFKFQNITFVGKDSILYMGQ